MGLIKMNLNFQNFLTDVLRELTTLLFLLYLENFMFTFAPNIIMKGAHG